MRIQFKNSCSRTYPWWGTSIIPACRSLRQEGCVQHPATAALLLTPLGLTSCHGLSDGLYGTQSLAPFSPSYSSCPAVFRLPPKVGLLWDHSVFSCIWRIPWVSYIWCLPATYKNHCENFDVNLELLKGVSSYWYLSVILKKGLTEFQNVLPQHIYSAALKHHSIHFASLFPFVSFTPNSVVFSDPFMFGSYFPFPLLGHCGVFHVLFRGWLLSAIFPSSLFWHFSLSTLWPWKWMFVQLALPFCCSCFRISVELQEKRGGQRVRQATSQSLKVSFPSLFRGLNEKNSCKSVAKKWCNLWSPRKPEVITNSL